MSYNEVRLSAEQINKMKHAIGLTADRIKYGRYEAFRNYYATGDNAEWNEIVNLGLAQKCRDPFNDGDAVYHLTERGIEYLSFVTGVKISVNR